jgi:hypothetical protein
MGRTSPSDLDVTFRPLRQWPDADEPTAPEQRQSSRFRAPWSSTVELLGKELRQLDAENVALQVDLRESQIRNDGLPYARSSPDEPGVVLSFDADGESYMWPCDTYHDWQDNVRAIALTLEKLRAVDRYGVSQSGEQYVGWQALPADVDERIGPEEAARILAGTAPEAREEHADGDRDAAVDVILDDEQVAGRFYREAAKRSHPDRPDVQSDAHFKRVQQASHVLDQHFSRDAVAAVR